MEEKYQLFRDPSDKGNVYFQKSSAMSQDRETRDCKHCRFCDQDVDTYPCDRCHTRH